MSRKDKYDESREQRREEKKEKVEKIKEAKKEQRAEKKEKLAEQREERRQQTAESRAAARAAKKIRNQQFKQTMKGFASALLAYFIMSIHFVIDKLVALCLEKYWGERKRCPRLTKNQFITKSAVELAGMIRKREITSHQLVQAYIERIAETNSLVNAVLDGPFVEALDEAKAIDDRLESNLIADEEFNRKPFLGVPFSTKDSTACKNKLHTLGILARRTIKAKEDAECVKQIKEAGAILICTSNIPEINRWQETRNKIVGQTNNPYDFRRTVGGSSGGEAALLASCSTAFGLGTDVGGSIRMPSFYCGVFGHKPTVGVINTKGCTLRTGKEPTTMVVAGPMTRYASDLMPIFKVLAGPEKSAELLLNEEVDLAQLKFYYMSENGDLRCSSVSGDMNSALMKAVDHFANLSDGSVQKVALAGTEKSTKMWRYWMTQEPASFNTLLGNGRKLNPFVEIFKMLTMQSEYTLASVYCLIDELLPKENADQIKEITRKCDEELTELLGDDGILLYPGATKAAPFHYSAFFKPYDFAYWSLFNVLHVPVTTVPMGLNADGLPLGVQVVATRNRDRHCIAVAEELEKVFGGWAEHMPFLES